MGAAYLLPRLVGHGVASELLLFGNLIGAEEALRIGLVNRVADDGDSALDTARNWARDLARGPAFAHAMTKKMLWREWDMNLADAVEAEAVAQAECMQHPDFRTAHDAFKNKGVPVFDGATICDDGGA